MHPLQQYDDLVKGMAESIDSLKTSLSEIDRPTVVFVGRNATFEKGWKFINSMISSLPDYHWLGISETPLLEEADVKEALNFDSVVIPIRAPIFGWYDVNKDVVLNREVVDLIEAKGYVREAITNLSHFYLNMGKNYPELMCWYFYSYYKAIIDYLRCHNQPFIVVMWGEGPASHYILKNICDEMSIPVRFMELGTFWGTINLESGGQCGRNYFAVHPWKSKMISVSKKELMKTKEVLNYLYEKKSNRNAQIDSTEALVVLKSQLKPNRPIVVFYTMFDYECFLVPWTDKNKKERSPIFSSSEDATKFLMEMADKNDWNLIIKYHPIFRIYQRKLEYGKHHAIILEDFNVNDLLDISDVTVTMYSQICFESLIRGKPVVLLGYNQMKRQGCAYECYDKEKIEITIEKALEQGYTDKQRNKFELLSTRMMKKYMYDDLSEREIRWGLSIEECKTELIQAMNKQKKYNKGCD